jgi:hypothetical protein
LRHKGKQFSCQKPREVGAALMRESDKGTLAGL